MGVPMVRNLMRAGFEVTVYNRTAAKAAPLQAAGAGVVASAAALWEVSDVVITMVADDAALKGVYEGGFRDGARAGKTVIDMSTVSPATSRELAGQLAAKGVEYLDAPVAGSVKPAELGQRITEALTRERIVPRFVDSYVIENGRHALQVHASLYRDLLSLLQREALLA